ncbi:hypothetical protein HDU98_003503 [Podochytrium sp. JEL0797]|nr:hypothetical protein HDU98_003503 [Podochytrium sp. JEL0797]
MFERAVYEDAKPLFWYPNYVVDEMGVRLSESENRVMAKALGLSSGSMTVAWVLEFLEEKDDSVIAEIFPNTARDETSTYSTLPMLRLEYDTVDSMRYALYQFKMMAEVRSGIPRSGCKGVTQLVYKNKVLIFIAPSKAARSEIMNASGELLDDGKSVIKIMPEFYR